MGWLSDFIGGKKAPGPPPGIKKAAEARERVAEDWERLYGDVSPLAATAGPQVGRYGDEALQATEELFPFADEFADKNTSVWRRWLDAEKASQEEALAAGSPERQNFEQQRATASSLAGSNAAVRAHMQRLRNIGIGGASGAIIDPTSSIISGAYAGAAGDQARITERNYGEGVRRSLLPIISERRDAARNAALFKPGIRSFARDTAYENLMREISATLGATGALDATGQAWDESQGSWVNSYNAELNKHNADAQRKSRIWGTVGDIAGKIAGAAGGAGGGAGGGGAGGGGEFARASKTSDIDWQASTEDFWGT